MYLFIGLLSSNWLPIVHAHPLHVQGKFDISNWPIALKAYPHYQVDANEDRIVHDSVPFSSFLDCLYLCFQVVDAEFIYLRKV